MTDLTFDSLQHASVDGTRLAYHESGQGDPVILVHGTASDIRTWSEQIPSLSDAHRVIAYSRRYARPNDEIPDGVDDQMMPHVNDLKSFQQAVNAHPAHLVGHSWGAFVCLLAAITNPDSVKSLVLLE
ncbi:MAG: alpha/beta fold hydrolase, partial [candidate division Zixibacteria bacterium]|nr:alpha/beta fold hydrolase [candidate division Zixibacteria bacterium]